MIDGAQRREHARRYTSLMRQRSERVKRCVCCRAIVDAFGGYQHQRAIEWHDGVEITYVVSCMSHYCRARAARGEV